MEGLWGLLNLNWLRSKVDKIWETINATKEDISLKVSKILDRINAEIVFGVHTIAYLHNITFITDLWPGWIDMWLAIVILIAAYQSRTPCPLNALENKLRWIESDSSWLPETVYRIFKLEKKWDEETYDKILESWILLEIFIWILILFKEDKNFLWVFYALSVYVVYLLREKPKED